MTMSDPTQTTAAAAQQATKKAKAAIKGEVVTAIYLGGEDERTPEQLEEGGVKSTVDELGGRPIMGVLFKKHERTPVTGDVLIKKLRSLATHDVFEVVEYDKKDGEPQAQKLFVAPVRDMVALRKKALAQEAKRRGSVV
jgi:hypothetical protein